MCHWLLLNKQSIILLQLSTWFISWLHFIATSRSFHIKKLRPPAFCLLHADLQSFVGSRTVLELLLWTVLFGQVLFLLWTCNLSSQVVCGELIHYFQIFPYWQLLVPFTDFSLRNLPKYLAVGLTTCMSWLLLISSLVQPKADLVVSLKQM